jgi:hypothetical protein
MPLFKKMLSNSMYEGMKIVQAAGVSEYRAENMPSWGNIKASATLPDFKPLTEEQVWQAIQKNL